MNYDFLAPASRELEEAVAYYNSQSEGLGFEFAAEIKRTMERIGQYPDAWQFLSRRTRRCRTNRFPYGVVYQVRDKSILIVAVMNLRQDPKIWKFRIRKRVKAPARAREGRAE